MIEINDLVKFIGNHLYNFETTSRCLGWAWNSKQNIILYGNGGYGKSEGAKLFTQYLLDKGLIKEKPYTMNFSKFTTEELLLGGLDIKKFQNEGTIWYNLLNSFVNNEVFIAEELFDAELLTILKDILESGEVRLGNQIFPIKTKMVIACTNKSREEVVTDASSAALFERFLFEHCVEWESWNYKDYTESMKITTKDLVNELMQMVAFICQSASKEESKISPRICNKAYYSAKINGFESLFGIKDLKPHLQDTINHFGEFGKDKSNRELLILKIKEIKDLKYKNIEEVVKSLSVIKTSEKETVIRDNNSKIGNQFKVLCDKTKENIIEFGKSILPTENLSEIEQKFYGDYIKVDESKFESEFVDIHNNQYLKYTNNVYYSLNGKTDYIDYNSYKTLTKFNETI